MTPPSSPIRHTLGGRDGGETLAGIPLASSNFSEHRGKTVAVSIQTGLCGGDHTEWAGVGGGMPLPSVDQETAPEVAVKLCKVGALWQEEVSV